MSWLWGSKKEETPIPVNEERDEPSLLSPPDDEDDDDDSVDASTKGPRERDQPKHTAEESSVHSEDDDDDDDYESSEDESSVEDSEDDDDDDDDDSIVVDLVETMTTDDEDNEFVSDNEEDDEDASLVEEESEDEDDEPVLTTDDENDQNEDAPEHDKAPTTEHDKAPTADTTSKEEDNGPTPSDDDNDDDDDDDEPVATFWEKQSLLLLAAEHDRVDILKTLLKDENEEKETLMNSGIPPLHLAITFGSVNTAQSLLRMGANPSVRPNIEAVLEERKKQPKDSKVEIPNIHRFDGLTAWELAFGNALYDDKSHSARSWSIFGSEAESSNTKVIKPVDMALSKREGIRHAFTAEALRCVGGDEAQRLKQLVASGMPATIDIGGKDLYGWAVDMGALQCEEFLRPVEAAKYDDGDGETNDDPDAIATTTGETDEQDDGDESSSKSKKKQSSFVVHRPDETHETIPQLKNRLDELESLSMALSTCLDNLAEEVSVCHGLLLMGGGASALASHVRSLRDLKEQKLDEMEAAYAECTETERELRDLIHSTGSLGQEIASASGFRFLMENSKDNTKNDTSETTNDGEDGDDSSTRQRETEAEKLNIKAQIAASENKIRKLRASIADLSEENTIDLKEVQNRGLEGGIHLVRGFREELRDIEFNLSEIKSRKATCKAKINMILARIPSKQPKQILAENSQEPVLTTKSGETDSDQPKTNESTETEGIVGNEYSAYSDIDEGVVVASPSEINALQAKESQDSSQTPGEGSQEAYKSNEDSKDPAAKEKKASIKISSGDSQAIAVIQPGNRGFFTIDLWEVLLRIMGYERAANRRSIHNLTTAAQNTRRAPPPTASAPHVMII